MDKINFQDGTKVSSAKVTIDEVDYPVTPARYNGATPLSSTILNTMQTNIENAIDQNADNIGGEDYDATSTYEVGDIVKYQGQLYICITDITTAEVWNSNHWQETDVLSSAGGNEIAIGTSSDITGKTKIYVEEATRKLKYKDSTTGNFNDIAGDEVVIGSPSDVTNDTKILIDEDEETDVFSEVVDSLSGNEVNKAPSVRAVKQDLNIYSTTEQRIGTWIDGKPLYRKTFTGTIQTTGSGTNTIVIGTLSNVDAYVNAYGTYMHTDSFYNSIDVYLNSSLISVLQYEIATGKLYFTVNTNSATRTYYITIEYTKTTDTANS